MKKIVSLLFIILIIFSSCFAFDDMLNRLFYKPGIYIDYLFDFSFEKKKINNLNLGVYFIGKYPIMMSDDLLKVVWSEDRKLIGGQMAVESSYYTHAISKSNAIGLLQFLNGTANDLKIENLFDPLDNLKGSLEYHGYLSDKFKNQEKQFAAYFEGPGAVSRNGASAAGKNYYQKVVNSSKVYKNTNIYSPYMFGMIMDYNFIDELLDINLSYGMAYRKFEFYADGNLGLKKQADTYLKEGNISLILNYYPLTSFSFAPSININLPDMKLKNYYYVRIGYPWNNLITRIGYNDYLYFKIENKLDYYFFKFSKEEALAGYGLKVQNIRFGFNYNLINNAIGINLLIF